MDVTSLLVIVLVTALTTAAIVGLVVSRAMKSQGGLSAQDIRQQVADASREHYLSAAQMLETSTEARLQTTTSFVAEQNRAASASIQEIIKPLGDSLKALDIKVGDLETKRADAYARLDQQVTNTTGLLDTLRTETTNLSSALRRNDARGRWGELQLRRIIEMIGMSEHVSFDEQKQQVGDGSGRPDVTIHLPNNRVLYVDSKAPMNSYLDAINEVDPDRRKTLFEAHATALKGHIKALSSRNYVDDKESLNYVIMFIPTESSLAAAFEVYPNLIEDAAQAKVVLTSPTSLVIALNTIAMLWQEDTQVRNAQEMIKESGDLYGRLITFINHFSKVGDNLKRSMDTYNNAIGSFDRSVMPKAKAVEELGRFTDELPIAEKLEVDLRESRYATHETQLGLVGDSSQVDTEETA
ncbi:MAG: DNA recombination protein RmuC [Candidatus Nanopelagicales bacterium]|jgi:DNA recombination protein RmuC|nr:DNA recombination protein RmuC [Candidatus Nanopelagicales bacterium]MDP4896131.1 DNA recombination protein RmuC [Candidatus Nanopelagicales bacterium]